jgi:Leucine-rich repeat (LRR) protein
VFWACERLRFSRGRLAVFRDSMDFRANCIECWRDGGAESVFFGNAELELALTLAKVPGTTGHTCEWNDQANVCSNAVDSIQLSGPVVRIRLLAEAAEQLGETNFVIELDCEDGTLEEVGRRLAAIFGDRFRAGRPAGRKAAPATQKDFSKIKYLNLEGKDLRALPDEVGEMTALETAKLGRNPRLDFHAVCEVLSQLPALRELSFTTDGPVPENIGGLTALESLQLTGFTTPQVLPEGLGKLKKLKSILIMSEADVVLPESFADLAELEQLTVRARSWQLPTRFDRLARLTGLDLSQCRLARAPEGMADMAAVTWVALGGGEGCDYEQILSVVARMANVERLELTTNPVPKAVGLCRQIRELVIWAGVDAERPLQLPEEMFGLRQLKTLVMSRNCFAEIPEGIGRLQGLETLAIDESEFEELPETLGDLENLTFLNLSENPLLRALPESLGRLRRLQGLRLDDDLGLVRLPDSARELTGLETVSLSGTEQVENVPESWKLLLGGG